MYNYNEEIPEKTEKKGPYYGMPKKNYDESLETEFHPSTEAYVAHTFPQKMGKKKQPLPMVTILILAANIIAAILSIGVENTFRVGGINYEYITINKEYGRLLSYMFLHADFEHLLNNMVSLLLLGKMVETELGALRMAIIYFGSGIGTGFVSMELEHMFHPERMRYAAGASGAVFGILCAALLLTIMRKDKVSRKNMFLAIGFVVVYAWITSGANIDIYGHIGGAVIGGILTFLLNIKKWEFFKENQYCRMLAIFGTLILCVMGIGEAHIGKSETSLMDEKVVYVREQGIWVDETRTYGETLDAYCTEENWKSFVTTDKEQVVQFEGEAYYKGSYRQLCIQFLVYGDCESYKLSYFAMDDVAQTWEQAEAFMNVVCGKK